MLLDIVLFIVSLVAVFTNIANFIIYGCDFWMWLIIITVVISFFFGAEVLYDIREKHL